MQIIVLLCSYLYESLMESTGAMRDPSA